MLKHFLRTCSLVMLIALATMPPSVGSADEHSASQIREEVWSLLLHIRIFAYLVRPVGTGPFPPVIMNYGISFDRREGSFHAAAEFRAAHWFAHHGYVVIVPIGPSAGSGILDLPDREFYKLYFSAVEDCDDPYPLTGSDARETANKWINGRPESPCFGYIPRTIRILDLSYPSRCMRHLPVPAAQLNITCSLHLAATGTS